MQTAVNQDDLPMWADSMVDTQRVPFTAQRLSDALSTGLTDFDASRQLVIDCDAAFLRAWLEGPLEPFTQQIYRYYDDSFVYMPTYERAKNSAEYSLSLDDWLNTCACYGGVTEDLISTGNLPMLMAAFAAVAPVEFARMLDDVTFREPTNQDQASKDLLSRTEFAFLLPALAADCTPAAQSVRYQHACTQEGRAIPVGDWYRTYTVQVIADLAGVLDVTTAHAKLTTLANTAAQQAAAASLALQHYGVCTDVGLGS